MKIEAIRCDSCKKIVERGLHINPKGSYFFTPEQDDTKDLSLNGDYCLPCLEKIIDGYKRKPVYRGDISSDLEKIKNTLKKKCKEEIENESPKQKLSQNSEAPIEVYGVKWIESEFGKRDEGYRLFLTLEKCIEQTKEDSRKGPYDDGGGYLGPERPLSYIKIPFSCLPEKYKDSLMNNAIGFTHTKNSWVPEFKSVRVLIE